MSLPCIIYYLVITSYLSKDANFFYLTCMWRPLIAISSQSLAPENQSAWTVVWHGCFVKSLVIWILHRTIASCRPLSHGLAITLVCLPEILAEILFGNSLMSK